MKKLFSSLLLASLFLCFSPLPSRAGGGGSGCTGWTCERTYWSDEQRSAVEQRGFGGFWNAMGERERQMFPNIYRGMGAAAQAAFSPWMQRNFWTPMGELPPDMGPGPFDNIALAGVIAGGKWGKGMGGGLIRRFPRGSSNDTIFGFFDASSGKMTFQNAHASTTPFIGDKEIASVLLHPDEFQNSIGGVRYGVSPTGQAVLQQVSTRGCGHACTAMLGLDNQRPLPVEWLADELSTIEAQVAELGTVGLKTKVTHFPYGMDRQVVGQMLDNLVLEGGPGLLGVTGEIGGHAIVLDSLSMSHNVAIIRDPYHGWQIITTAEAILKRFPSELIQIR